MNFNSPKNFSESQMDSSLALDYGSKQVGLALSDNRQRLALPYGQIENKSEKFVLEEIKKICQQKGISRIIIGLPISLTGQKEKSAKDVFKFIQELKRAVEVPVITEDERLTSKMAQKLLRDSKNKKADHSVAAMLILQSYLDKLKIKTKIENTKQGEGIFDCGVTRGS